MQRVSQKIAAKSPFAFLLTYLWRYKLLLAGALGSIIMAAVIMLILPIVVRNMLDYGFKDIAFHFSFLLLLALLLAVASALRYFCVSILGENIVNSMRSDIFGHILTLPMSFFDSASSGEIVSRLSADATQVKDAIASVSSIALRNFLMAIGGFVMMFITSYRLSLLELSIVPIILVPIILLARKVRVKARLAQDDLAAANSLAAEAIANIKTINSYTNETLLYNKFIALLESAFQAALSSVWLRALLTGGAIFFVFASVIATLYLGFMDVLTHRLSVGQLGQFILYALFSASSFGQLAEVGSQLMQALGALERLYELSKEEKQQDLAIANDSSTLTARGDINFQNVAFSYSARPDHLVLDNLSLAIKAGQRVAFVGKTGAGKTTIFSLLLRFYGIQQGKILLDGVDIKNLPVQFLRKNIAYVSQDNAIFDGTIYENIAMGKAEATWLDIEAAARKAKAYEFIADLPKGFDTVVGERGLMLSGGQKQRIALSRAFLKDAPILLLDEATSALDANSEAYVQEALERLSKHKTVLIIAHRLATVLNAEQIFVLDKGQIIEYGNHKELLEKNGAYARLVKLQFKASYVPIIR
ncbi:ABC transporter transmembrane domain-containing protein [Bartonella sp. TP]|uniref:ABC transporter transmembrane domain-containing protein n=1 Tax=Bartonella sp. TP TaxID=3057550 RepID=UPI0025B0D42C|nr:ABC transporter transmembrane domain-containing protein [Bartonella sp. TP]MDN5248880.1 ABC transporter transmembrane domain-containing protein [Alphaproteobacteria bacterium]WJW79596.1 ABC transporter transmembrane domain-containing protein [Bartonella sp. TP]